MQDRFSGAILFESAPQISPQKPVVLRVEARAAHFAAALEKRLILAAVCCYLLVGFVIWHRSLWAARGVWIFDNWFRGEKRRKVPVMNTPLMAERELGEPVEVDPVQEIRLRIWARKNYAPAEKRDASWHPVILDEMEQKDSES